MRWGWGGSESVNLLAGRPGGSLRFTPLEDNEPGTTHSCGDAVEGRFVFEGGMVNAYMPPALQEADVLVACRETSARSVNTHREVLDGSKLLGNHEALLLFRFPKPRWGYGQTSRVQTN